MESSCDKTRNDGDGKGGVKVSCVSEGTAKEQEVVRRSGPPMIQQQEKGKPSEPSSQAGLKLMKTWPSNQEGDRPSMSSNVYWSDTPCPAIKGDPNKVAVGRIIVDRGSKTIPGPVRKVVSGSEPVVSRISVTKIVPINNFGVVVEDETHREDEIAPPVRKAISGSEPVVSRISVTKVVPIKNFRVIREDGTHSEEEMEIPPTATQNKGSSKGNSSEKLMQHRDVSASRRIYRSEDAPESSDGGHLKTTSKEDAASSDTGLEWSGKDADQHFLTRLGLRKIASEETMSDSKTNYLVTDKVCSSDKSVDQQRRAESIIIDHPTQVKPSIADQAVKIISDVGSKTSMIKAVTLVGPVSDISSSNLEVSSTSYNKDGQAAVASSSTSANVSKTSPLYIKVKLEEKEVTVICCPATLLHQHKEMVDLCLKENSEHEFSIKCRLCHHEVSEPHEMLQHLKTEHQIQGCLQKLINLNSQHLGCMTRPACINIPGVLSLPDGLNDMSQGVIRFSNVGIPRLSFVCRLCPLNFHTARGLSAHHHYFMRSAFIKNQPRSFSSLWSCKMCPRQFPNFIEYYGHHKWMRIAKDLFINTEPVIKKKKFEVVNENGKVVASVEVPGSHSLAIRTGPPSSIIETGWGLNDEQETDASTTPDTVHQSVIEIADQSDAESHVSSSGPTEATANSKSLSETDKEKTMVPPLFQTLDNLCRKMVQKGEISQASFDNSSPGTDRQDADDHEYMCAMCHKTFPRLAQMQGHMGSHVRKHRINRFSPLSPVASTSTGQSEPPFVADEPSGVEPNDVKYKCGVCSETFPKLAQMQTHMERHNRVQPAIQFSVRSLDSPFSETVKLMSLTCDICHWSFSSEQKLWNHRLIHTNTKKTVEEAVETNSTGSSHSASSAQKKKIFLCIFCKKTFSREVNLRFHMKRHAAKSAVADGNEQKSSNVASDSNKPEKVAIVDKTDTEQNHDCKDCNRTFNTSKQLKSHLAWHHRRDFQSPKVASKQDCDDADSSTTCNKNSDSTWELRFARKRSAQPHNFHKMKKRTLARRACNEKKLLASEKDKSDSNIRGRSVRLYQGMYKFYCRNCKSYFSDSQLYTKHLAAHNSLAKGKARKPLRNSPRRGRRLPTRVAPEQKLEDEHTSLSLKYGNSSADSNGDSCHGTSPSPNEDEEEGSAMDTGPSETDQIVSSESMMETENELTMNTTTSTDEALAVDSSGQSAPEALASERHEAESPVSDRSLATDSQVSTSGASQKQDGDLSSCSAPSAAVSSFQTEGTSQATRPLGAPTKPQFDPVIKEEFKTSDVPDKNNDSEQSMDCTEVNVEEKSPPDGERDKNSSSVTDASRGTRPNITDDKSSNDVEITTDGVPPTKGTNDSNDWTEETIQDTRTRSSRVQSTETDDAMKQTSTATSHDTVTVIKDASWETRAASPKVPDPKTQPQPTNDSMKEHNYGLTAPSVDSCEPQVHALKEEANRSITPSSSVVTPAGGIESHSQMIGEISPKPDGREDHLDSLETMEHSGQVAEPVKSDAVSQDASEVEVHAHVQDGGVSSPSVVCAVSTDGSEGGSQETRPVTSAASSSKTEEGHSESNTDDKPAMHSLLEKSPTESGLTKLPPSTDDSGINKGRNSNSSTTLLLETEGKPSSKIPQQKQDGKLTTDLANSNDLSAVTERSRDTRTSDSPVEIPKISKSVSSGNSEELMDTAKASEDKSVEEMEVGGVETTGNKDERREDSSSEGTSPILTTIMKSTVCSTAGGESTTVKQGTSSTAARALNPIGLSNIIEKLRQKLGSAPVASYTGISKTSTVIAEVKPSSSETGTSGSDDEYSQDEHLTKLSSTEDDSSVVSEASQEERPAVLDGGEDATAAKTNSQASEDHDGDKMIKCSLCTRKFGNVYQLNAHKRSHVRLRAKKDERNPRTSVRNASSSRLVHEKVYRCDICSKSFKDYKRLCGHKGAHVSHKHKMTSLKKPEEKDESSASQDETPKANHDDSLEMPPKVLRCAPGERGQYSCRFCDKSFQRLIQFRRHVMSVHPTAKGKVCLLRPFVCELCGKSFTKSRQRLIHMKLHLGTRRRRRLRKKMLQFSESDHTYFKKLPSEKAPKEIVQTQNTSQNTNVAEREDARASVVETPKGKFYKCHLCEKLIQDQQQLAKHMNLHQRYSCRFCSASFTLARQLCGHLKVHGGLKGNTDVKSQDDTNQDDSSNESITKPSSSLQSKESSRPVTRRTANSQSRNLLEKVIKMYLFGVKPKKKRLLPFQRNKANSFKPKRSLQRALMKSDQARMQKVYAVLRKSIILEIDADTHRIVFECGECKKSFFSHKVILYHYLEKHLLEIDDGKNVPSTSTSGKEDKAPSPRFRNKSKIGCPICKVSSGFQCHLHNQDGAIYIDSILGSAQDDNLLACDKCEERFSSHSKLVQHRQGHTKSQEVLSCSLCPFQARSLQGLGTHQQVHRSKEQKAGPAKDAQSAKQQFPVECPLCPFKIRNIYALAAHSRIHKGGRGIKKPLPEDYASPSTPPPEADQPSSPVPGIKERKNSYNCRFCPKYFYSLSSYLKHTKMHLENSRFKCSQCASSFVSGQELNDHVTSAHSAPNAYRCTECSFSSETNESLQEHLKSHSLVKGKGHSSKSGGASQKQRAGSSSSGNDKKANWSSYLNEILQSRVVVNSANSDKSPVKEDSSSSPSLPSQDENESMPMHTISQGPSVSDSEYVIVKETSKPVEQVEVSPVKVSDSPDEYFACSQCKDFQASSKEEWDSHMSSVHQGSPGSKYKCSMCQYTTSKEERLTQHMRLHRVQTLQCNSCPYRTPQNHLMIRHIQTVHKQHKPFKCKLCTYCTSYRHHLRRHSEKHKNPNFRCRYRKLMKKGDLHSSETLDKVSRVTCSDCGRDLLNKKTLRNHCIKVHGRFPGSRRSHKTPQTNTNCDGSKPKVEDATPLSFSVVQQDENLHECSVCSLKFKRRSDLNKHMSNGHSETKASLPCQCPQCGLVTGSGQLEAHMKIHQEENLLVCEEEGCDFKAAEEVHMQHHKTKHAAESNALKTCRFCQIKFSDAVSLRMHNLQHHGEKTRSINAKAPFLCSQCPFVSTNEKDANRHFKLHNYNLAFKCEYCVFSSSTASAIATHQKIHRYPRRIPSSTLVSKKASQRQKIRSGVSSKSAAAASDSTDSSSVVSEQGYPKHVFVSNKGKKLYECRYCQRFFDIAEAWQRHEHRHMAEWPAY